MHFFKKECLYNYFYFFKIIYTTRINLDYSRVKNVVRSGDNAASKGVSPQVRRTGLFEEADAARLARPLGKNVDIK